MGQAVYGRLAFHTPLLQLREAILHSDMTTNTNLQVRVNGRLVNSLKVRRELRGGAYTGENEIVMFDSQLGPFPLDPFFDIELKDASGQWQRINLPTLFQNLVEAGAIPKY